MAKIVYQSLITTIPRHIVNELKKIQKAFLRKNHTPKIKCKTLYNGDNGRGLKNIDISNRIICLQCLSVSWMEVNPTLVN